MGVSEVADPYSMQAGTQPDCAPWSMQVQSRLLWIVASNHVTAEPRQASEHSLGSCVEHDGFLTRLRIREKQHAALKVDLLSAPFQTFARPSSTSPRFSDLSYGAGSSEMVSVPL